MKWLLSFVLVFVCVSDHSWLDCKPETGDMNLMVFDAINGIKRCGGRGQRTAKLLSMDEMASETSRRKDQQITELQEIDLLKDRLTVLENDLFLMKGKRK
jgi:hypothetical protein